MPDNARGLASRIAPELLVCSIHRAADASGRWAVKPRGAERRFPPKYLLRKRAISWDDLSPQYEQRADRAIAGQLMTWKNLNNSAHYKEPWKGFPPATRQWMKVFRTGVAVAGAAFELLSETRSHLPVLATFVDYSDHWLGMIWIVQCDTFTTECLAFTPDRGFSTLELTCALDPCGRDDCDSTTTGAAAVDVLRILWNRGMDEQDVVPRELVLADEHLAGYAEPAVREAIETLATFFLVAEKEDGLEMTAAGEKWLLAHERIGNRELLEDALPKERSNRIKATFHGDVVNSNVAIGGTQIVFDAAQRRTLREFARWVDEERDRLELNETERAELDGALAEIREAADATDGADPGRLRRALRTVGNLGAALLVGASGNALYEAAKAVAGLG